MLDLDVVEQSASACTNPLVIVRKSLFGFPEAQFDIVPAAESESHFKPKDGPKRRVFAIFFRGGIERMNGVHSAREDSSSLWLRSLAAGN